MKKNISNAERIADSSFPGISRMVKPEIIIEGKIIRYFKHFSLQQSAKTHHTFELIFAHDSLDPMQNHQLSEAQKFLGRRITVVFRYKDTENESPERTFVGVVTQVAFSQEQMSLGDIVLKGASPTLLMDAAPHFQSFGGEKPVNTSVIAQKIISQSLNSSKFDIRIDAQNKSYINYSAQYNETHYNYLARLAEAYGEQFYYDGEVLHFGKLPPHEKPLVLTYGSNVRKIRVELNTVYTKPTYFGYNSSKDLTMTGIDQSVRHSGELAAQSYGLNENIFTFNTITPAPISANMDLDIDRSQESTRGSAAVEVFTVSGETLIPFLYPGCVADLEMRKPDSKATSYFTRLMITEVSHEVDALGNYKGSFKAIAEGTGFMPRPEFTIPKAEPQIATVISNTDPQSQGRIRVRFQWQAADSSTHFIRMMSPDAGGTGAVPQNRGFVAIPETGDQVMVNFEYHHPDFPFAMGGMFHGKNAQGGGIDNHLKSLQTRSGIKVLMNDLDKSITIEDPSGNSYFMDGKGNIRITAPGNMEFSAGKHIIMNSGENLEVRTGNSMEFISGNRAAFHMMSGALFSTPLMEMSVPTHLNIQSGKTSMLSEEETTIQGRTTHLAGMEKLMIHSDQETTVNSKGTTHVLGKDGNSHSNIPRDYNPLKKTMEGRCLIHFRPKTTWNGEGYGFDWVRAGDTNLPGDQDYREVTGRMDGKNFIKDEREYLKLISTFRSYTFDYIDAEGKVTSMSYAFPYLSLYPKSYFRKSRGAEIKKDSVYTNTTADLDLMVDIKRPVDSIKFKYDTNKFAITHDPFPLSAGNHKINASITCLEEIENDFIIEVDAKYEGPDGKTRKILVGGLVVKANKKRYEAPIVFIEVKTDIGNGKTFGEIWAREHETQIYLNQALINPVFKDKVSLDCSVDVHAISGIKHNRQSRINAFTAINKDLAYVFDVDKHGDNLMKFLIQELEVLYPDKYNDITKVFVINEKCDHAAGYALSQYKAAVLLKGGFDADNRNVTTHEIMHVLGLSHTFSHKSPFIFKQYSTDNIMDYSDTAADFSLRKNVYTTTHWQWKIMQENAKIERSSSRFFKHPDPLLFLSF